MGDLFWFALPTGRRILLRCVAVTGDERDNYPTVEVFDWEDGDPPIEPASLIPREAKSHAHGRWADMMCLVRYAGDPDPADRIRVVKTGTPITRRRTLPATMVPWVDLEEALASMFGMEEVALAMNDEAKVARVIRINTIAGSVIVGLVVLSAALVAVGGLTLDGRAIVSLVFGLVLASLMFLTARSAKQDLADPAGAELAIPERGVGVERVPSRRRAGCCRRHRRVGRSGLILGRAVRLDPKEPSHGPDEPRHLRPSAAFMVACGASSSGHWPGTSHFFLATVRPDGRPHVAGMGALWVDGRFYFVSGAGTRKSRNLAGRPDCVISVNLPGLDLVVEGTAPKVTDEPTLHRLAQRFDAQGWPATAEDGAIIAPYSAPSAGPPPWDLYEFTPRTAFGVASAEPHGATRWDSET